MRFGAPSPSSNDTRVTFHKLLSEDDEDEICELAESLFEEEFDEYSIEPDDVSIIDLTCDDTEFKLQIHTKND